VTDCFAKVAKEKMAAQVCKNRPFLRFFEDTILHQ
jgi:hypothetical protein